MQIPINTTLSLPHHNERNAGILIDTIVIHSICPTSQGSVSECIALLDSHKVSAHYLLSREGELYQLVTEEKRAWHAGVSKLPFIDDPRDNVNDFSIGIELVDDGSGTFTLLQYKIVNELIAEIKTRHSIKYVLGHSDIAPGRKVDPGNGFEWAKVIR